VEFFAPAVAEGAGVIGAAAGERQEVIAPLGGGTDDIGTLKLHSVYPVLACMKFVHVVIYHNTQRGICTTAHFQARGVTKENTKSQKPNNYSRQKYKKAESDKDYLIKLRRFYKNDFRLPRPPEADSQRQRGMNLPVMRNLRT
jgi:hypothetical protein